MIDKVQFRADMRARRKAACEADSAAALKLAQHAQAMLQGLFSDRLPMVAALYHAIGSEVDAHPLADWLGQKGIALALPVVTDRAAPMIFRRWVPGDPLEPDLAGCPAPLPLSETVDPELILAPLLAFDRRGVRLGQGGGHYDRTFAVRPHVPRVGLAYGAQGVAMLPREPHDVMLDGVLTETGYTAFA